jgi:hypothetical protein
VLIKEMKVRNIKEKEKTRRKIQKKSSLILDFVAGKVPARHIFNHIVEDYKVHDEPLARKDTLTNANNIISEEEIIELYEDASDSNGDDNMSNIDLVRIIDKF